MRLRLENAVIKYGNRTIIKNVSLKAENGEMIFVTGSNGSGKSTLIKGIAGLIPLSSGKISRSEKISYVPQIEESDKNFPAKVKEIVMTGTQRRNKIFYTYNDKKTALKYMNKLGILNISNNEIKTLSGGQLKRVYIARALSGEPDLLLLDEPCAGLDSETHKILFETLKEILLKGCAIVMVTHDISDIDGIRDSRVINISNGEINE